jgi:trans-aconitate 2-methyltransferase
MAVREWDGRSYDRISAPMQRLGDEVLARLRLRGDETVLDVGCGSGRVTEALLELLPRGRVIGVDGSAAMIAAARDRLGDRAQLLVADAVALTLPEPVDVVFSTATFHWIADHDRLFATLRGLLRPGGRLVAQCGGDGNVAHVRDKLRAIGDREPYAPHLGGWPGPWCFATPEQTVQRLHAAGFAAVETWLEERPVTTDDGVEWLRTIMLGSHLERLPADLRDRFVDDVHAALGGSPLVLRYVRLNLDATAI